MSGTINQPFTRTKLDVPSDRLRSIYRLCEQFPSLEGLFDLPKPYEFVTDSNAAIREVLFTSKYRRNESARTDLRESLESGIAKIIAPLELKTEMDRHLPTLALEKGVEVDKLRQDWQELQTYIEFREVVEYELPQTRVADPNDLPFVELYLNSNADAVLTYDKHISMMGAQALKPDELRFVRDYARTKAPEVTLRVGGGLIGGVAIGSLIALLKLVVLALRSFLKLPVEYQILVIGGLVLAFLHPATRKTILNGLSSLASSLRIPGNVLLEVVAELTVQFGEAQLDLKASQTILDDKIPRRVVPVVPLEHVPRIKEDSDSIVGIVMPVSVVKISSVRVRSDERRASTRSRRKPYTRKRPKNHEKPLV